MTDAYRISQTESERADKLRRAFELHRQGQLEQAARIYSTILEQAPDDADTLTLLGMLHYQRGDSGKALKSLAAATKAAPLSAETWSKYGSMLEAAGRLTEALSVYDRALIVRPNDAEVLFKRGNVLMQLRRFQPAAKTLSEVVALRPDHLGALNSLGTAFRILGFREEALANFNKALAIRPSDVATLKNCGLALQDIDRHDQALMCFDKALATEPRQLETLCRRSVSLHALGRFREALTSFDFALALDPRHEQSLIRRGDLLREMGRAEEAIASYDAVLALEPGHADALYRRGRALFDIWRTDEAIVCFDRAIGIDPNLAAAHNARGVALARLHRHSEALASHDRALALDPDNAEFNVNDGIARLRNGDFKTGWAKYEWRLRTQKPALARQFGSASWRGEQSLRGRAILLHAEQDIRDTLQFVRYAPLIAAGGGNVMLEVQPELKEVLAGTHGLSSVASRGDKLPAHDVNCPLPSLPLALATTLDSIPAKVPYLHAAPARKAIWTKRLARVASPRVGVVWSDQVESKKGQDRSIPLGRFLPLLEHPNVRFVSLQSDVHRVEASVLTQRPNVVDVGGELRDFSDVAAVISLLDLVVAVDAPVAHLAGAMGKPVWILLPFDADFRWMLEREDSPWYPTARLFRQPTPEDWDSVIARAQRELAVHNF
jgi:tetratricopeptide (TPR) repeat protein